MEFECVFAREEERSGGAVKQAAGKATGNRKLQAKGAAQKAVGTIQNKAGKAQDKMRSALRR